MNEIYTTWVVVCRNLRTGKIVTDRFEAKSAGNAWHCFNECYRHSEYQFLGAVDTEPEKRK